MSKFDELVRAVNENSTQTALAAQRVDELSVDVDYLNKAIVGQDGLSSRVTKVETKLSERTSALPKNNHRVLKMAGSGLGGGGLLAYVVYQFLTNPPWS